jgi:hypothetical protein
VVRDPRYPRYRSPKCRWELVRRARRDIPQNVKLPEYLKYSVNDEHLKRVI